MQNIFKKFRFRKTFTFLLTMLFLTTGSGCDDDSNESVLARNTDELSFKYSESTEFFSVLYNGAWKVSTDADWLSFSPSEGVGDGTISQFVYVTAKHNSSDSRDAIIYLNSDNTTLEIKVHQAAGIFEIGEPAISGIIPINSEIRATLNIPYAKAGGEEKIKVIAQLSGEASPGIEFPIFETTIEQAGDGFVSAPFIGIPTTMGELIIKAQIYIDNKLARESEIIANVMDETTLLMMSGTKFKWGGYYLEELPGVKSNRSFEITADDDSPENYDTYIVSCKYGDAGTVDIFATNAAYQQGLLAFRTARGLSGWTGAKVYEHPGYIKMGTGSVGGWIQTPSLAGIDGTSNITVEFEFFRWKGDTNEITVSAVDGGTLIGGTLPTNTQEWIKMSCVVLDATSATKIKWSATNLAEKGSRFTLRNVIISKAKEVKEPLSTPENIQTTATTNSLKFSWGGVPNATAYLVTLAESAKPQFVISKTVLNTQCTFDNLDADTEYIFTVKALYEENPIYNSEESEPIKIKTLI